MQYNSIVLSDTPSNVTLTIEEPANVDCVQATGPVPTSIGWYNPQGQLVLRDGGEEVTQVVAAGRLARLTFRSYQRSQGGRYECRVNVSGNNLEKLPVCIGECCTLGDFEL